MFEILYSEQHHVFGENIYHAAACGIEMAGTWRRDIRCALLERNCHANRIRGCVDIEQKRLRAVRRARLFETDGGAN